MLHRFDKFFCVLSCVYSRCERRGLQTRQIYLVDCVLKCINI